MVKRTILCMGSGCLQLTNQRENDKKIQGDETMTTLKSTFLSLLAVTAMGGMTFAQEMKKEVGAGEGQVNIVAWAGYIENGATDKAYDWVTDFEKKTSCKVNVKTAGTSDEMVALMKEGGFDLFTV